MKWHLRILTILGFLAAAVVLYLPVLDGDWVFDDVRLVASNDWLWRSFDGPSDEIQDWIPVLTEPDPAVDEVRVAFRPLRFISYRIDVIIAGALGITAPDQPGATTVFHLHNVILHGIAATLLFFLILRIYPGGGLMLAITLAGVFLVHPVQTEAVAWISGRRDVLFGVFYLAALLVSTGQRENPGWGRGCIVALLGALAMASKEMAATLPVALIAVSYMAPHDSDQPWSWRRQAPVWIPCAVVILFLSWRVLTLQDPGAGATYWGGSAETVFWSMGRALLKYMTLFLWPVGLSVDHSHAAFIASTGPVTPWTSIISWLVIVAGVFLSWRWWRRGSRQLALMVPLFIVLLSPVLQIFPHPERFAERFMYLPLVALLIGLAALLISFDRKMPGFRTPGTLILLLILALLGRARLADWEGPYPLWSSAVAAQPQCARAWFGRAEAARSRGWNTQAISDLGKTIEILSPIDRDTLQQGYFLQALQIRAGLLATMGGQQNLLVAQQHLQRLLEQKDTDGTDVSQQEAPWRESFKVRERLGDAEGARSAALVLIELPDVHDSTRLDAMLFLAATSSAADRARYIADARNFADRIGGRATALVAYQQGMLALEEQHHEQALKYFDEAYAGLDEKGRRNSARYRKSETLLKLGRAGEARITLEALLADDPGHLASHLSLAELLMAGRETDAAMEHFKTVLQVAPGNAQALQGIQQVLIRNRIESGETIEAQVDPTRVTALIMLSDRMMSRGEPDKAREALIEAEKHAEGPAERERRHDLWLRIARLDASQGRWKLARDRYRRLLESVPVDLRGNFVLEAAEVERRLGGPVLALDLLEKQLEAGVVEQRLYRQMGAIAHQGGLFKQAAQWYRKHLDEIVDQDPQVRSRIEEALQQVEEKIKAAEPDERDQ
ncbi:MAG: tetratricopeptide repeat protein [Planctomycetota bacterium]|nr:tetratricopeptide repeat protein [Planctomycetota bacterium]